jgi:hypothetical protein
MRGSEKTAEDYVRVRNCRRSSTALCAGGRFGPQRFLAVRRRGPGQRRWLSGEPPLGITSAYITNADRANADGANDDAIVHQLGWRW